MTSEEKDHLDFDVESVIRTILEEIESLEKLKDQVSSVELHQAIVMALKQSLVLASQEQQDLKQYRLQQLKKYQSG